MPLLTDAPHAVPAALTLGRDWHPVDLEGLGAPLAAVWRTFAGDARPWTAPAAGGGDRVVIVRDDVPCSQYDLMNETLAAGGALPDGLACVALTGARFRGQRGRTWTALRGNLHLSVHLAFDLDAARHQVGLTLMPAVATARAVEAVSNGSLRPGTKWVNDLMLGGRKVGGVLTASQVHGGRLRHAVVGIGVNVARAPRLEASARVPAAGCLADSDRAWSAEDGWARLLLRLLHELEVARAALTAGDGDGLFHAYRERAVFLGRRATIWPVDEGPDPDAVRPLARGRVLELLPDLSLRLEGLAEPVRSGRMTLDE